MRYRRALEDKKVESMLQGTLQIPIPKYGGVQENDCEKEVEVNLNMSLPPPESTTPRRKQEPKSPKLIRHRKKLIPSKVILTDNDVDIHALRRAGYRCPLCPDLKTMDFSFFTSHMLFHKRRPLKCTECNVYRANGSEAELDSCPLNKSRMEKQEAHTCSSSTLNEAVLKPVGLWTCEYCNEAFNSDMERDYHENKCLHFNAKKSIVLKNSCGICGKKYRNVVEFRFHMILEHPEIAKFCCYYCEERFPVKTKEGIDVQDFDKLKSHIKKCHYYDKFETRMVHDCDFCGEPFWSVVMLGHHMEREHGLDKRRTVSCEICFYRAENRCSITVHSKNIHYLEGKNLNVCDQCEYETLAEFKMEHHKFMEHGVEPKNYQILVCTEDGCNFRTIGRYKLNLHRMKEHNAARRHLCQICGKGFLNSSKLQSHKEIHVNEILKPFQCEICGNSFAVKNYLYIHMRLSHQNRPFASTNKKKAPRRKISSQPTSGNRESHELSQNTESTGNIHQQPLPLDNFGVNEEPRTSSCTPATPAEYLSNIPNFSTENMLTQL